MQERKIQTGDSSITSEKHLFYFWLSVDTSFNKLLTPLCLERMFSFCFVSTLRKSDVFVSCCHLSPVLGWRLPRRVTWITKEMLWFPFHLRKSVCIYGRWCTSISRRKVQRAKAITACQIASQRESFHCLSRCSGGFKGLVFAGGNCRAIQETPDSSSLSLSLPLSPSLYPSFICFNKYIRLPLSCLCASAHSINHRLWSWKKRATDGHTVGCNERKRCR